VAVSAGVAGTDYDCAPMPDVLIYGDTIRSPELRHELPLAIPDPFLYAETGGRRMAVIHSLEAARAREVEGIDVLSWEEIGLDDLIARDVDRDRIYLEIGLNACRKLGIESATVPPLFPVGLADHLRANGIELTVDRKLFAQRRRVKNEAELAGIRRAQRAAEAAMDAVRETLRSARPNGSGLTVGGEQLTSELLKRRIEHVFSEHGVAAEEFIVAHGAQSAVGHEMGSGPIGPNEPIVVDLWPRDRDTGCYADMTRTYALGEPSDELREWHRLVLEALRNALGGIRAGAEGRDLYVQTCELFQEHVYPTGLTKEPGQVLEDGFFHGLGHGVGLEVHEDPNMGRMSGDALVAGDVVTVEPGLYRTGFGGCRLEDLVLVTGSGAENLTDYPYDLEP
jgi:Xaa-Pro aminopeptidase